MAEPMDAFVTVCREKFQFLVDEFACRLVSKRVGRQSGGFVTILYQNSTTAIGIYYEVRDTAIWTVLMRLVDGKRPEYGDHVNRHGLWTVRRLRARDGAAVPRKLMGNTEADLERVVSSDATAVRTYAADILRGDFSIFPELEEIEKQ